MISRKTAMTILIVLVLAALAFVFGNVDVQKAEAQTAPTWIGTGLTAGKTPVFDSVPGDRRLTAVQVQDVTDWVGTFWGRNYDGVWQRISPQVGSTATDTTLSVSSGERYFRFTGITLEVIVTTSGSATFWGE